MEILLSMLPTFPLFILSVIIEYRFCVRLLQQRFSTIITFMILFGGEFLTGYLNYYFRIAGTIESNAMYNGFVFFVLCCLFFHGDMAKKIFVSVFVICGISTLYYVTLPLANYFFAENDRTMVLAFGVIKYINCFLCLVWMEYMGKKFQNLQHKPPQTYTLYLSFAFATLGMLIVWFAIFALDKQISTSLLEQMRAMQIESLHSRETHWRMLSGFRHDINNHLICLNNLLISEKYQETSVYIDSLIGTIKQLGIPVETGNEYADALLSVKYSEALKNNIDISIDMAVPKDEFIDPVDLCCILSNALDNAIAACNHIDKENRWIKARSFIAQNQFVIEILNSKPTDVVMIGDSICPIKISTDHGLGLQNVKSVVQKYGGILDLCADDVFSFSVMIPIKRL